MAPTPSPDWTWESNLQIDYQIKIGRLESPPDFLFVEQFSKLFSQGNFGKLPYELFYNVVPITRGVVGFGLPPSGSIVMPIPW